MAPADDSKKSPEVQAYRATLENVRADYPHLPEGALQQIALNQTKSQLANHQPGKISSTQSRKIQGIISTIFVPIFQPSKRQAKNCQKEMSHQDETIHLKSSHMGPSTRSIGMSNIAFETSSSSLADHSLSDSLANIEERESELDVAIKTIASASALGTEERLTGGSWVRRRASKRISMMSNLSDVDEEKELPTQQPSAVEKEVTPASQEYDADALFTDSLPDEIKIVINNLPSLQPMPSTECQERERRGSGVLKLANSKNRSENSSMSSIDTANFTGDFYCWKSVSSS